MSTVSDLKRFTDAQQSSFATALSEIQNGKKRSHWMWYIFPQIHGLGVTPTSQYYAIRSLQEAKDFLADPYLGGNLIKITSALLDLDTNNASAVFGFPDDLKLRSSMTLFAQVSDFDVFQKVLDKYFNGKPDDRTLSILARD